jgi:disulfide bond formation protein DsbB
MSQIKNKITLNLILLFSIFALVTAYFVQYILGHKPCNLCLIERLPYIFSIIIISLGLIIKKFKKAIISPKDMIIIEKI